MKKLSEMSATEKAFKILEAVKKENDFKNRLYIFVHPFTTETEEEREEVIDAINDLLKTDEYGYFNESIVDFYFRDYSETIITFEMNYETCDLWEDEIFRDAA